MTYDQFEDLPVWKLAADLAVTLFQWTSDAWFRGKGDLANQLQRATLSISNNIAEGFERGTTNELLQYLYIARGSAGEVRSMLAVVARMLKTGQHPHPQNHLPAIRDFKSQCEQISRQLRGWANSLQNSDIQGQRYLNDNTRTAYSQQKRRTAFQIRLNEMNQVAQQKREEATAPRHQSQTGFDAQLAQPIRTQLCVDQPDAGELSMGQTPRSEEQAQYQARPRRDCNSTARDTSDANNER